MSEVETHIATDAAGFAVAAVVTTPRAEGWSFRVELGANSMTLTAPKGEQLDSEAIRSLPLGQVLRAGRHAIVRHRLANMDEDDLTREAEKVKKGASRLEAVARMYRLALRYGLPPAATIGRKFDRSPVSAQRWIADARRAGLLGSAAEERELNHPTNETHHTEGWTTK